jgi:hypothetical protein
MPVSWHWTTEEKKITLFKVSGQWTWSEFLTAWNQGLDDVATLPHVAHAVVVFDEDVPVGYVPPYAISAILVNILRRRVPNAGMVVIVNVENWSINAVVNVVSRLSPTFRHFVHMAKTVDEAIEHIANVSLNDFV